MCKPSPGPRCLGAVEKQYDTALDRLVDAQDQLAELPRGGRDADQRERLTARVFALTGRTARLKDEVTPLREAARAREQARQDARDSTAEQTRASASARAADQRLAAGQETACALRGGPAPAGTLRCRPCADLGALYA